MSKLYAATIKLTGHGTQHVLIRADDAGKAKAMLEGQYGRGNITKTHTATTSDKRQHQLT